MAAEVPRPEHPDPQRMRADWVNLNGTWQFEIDAGRNGLESGWAERDGLADRITVPFCPESRLSGVGHVDFMPAVWYRRSFDVPAAWQGRRIRLHFGAVDFDATVWVNGQRVGGHTGGYAPFCFDVTSVANVGGTNTVVVYAEDDTRTGRQPSGKQSPRHGSFGCLYTRVTGIWQTVWLEAVGTTFIRHHTIQGDPFSGRVDVCVETDGPTHGLRLQAAIQTPGGPVIDEMPLTGPVTHCSLTVPDPVAWAPGNPHLYDVALSIVDGAGQTVDTVAGYVGLRRFEVCGHRLLLNGRPVFLRTVLDQGYYPDGLYTAPTDEALRNDVQLSLDVGFNGARLHQKAFEPRFLYWADALGYLVTGEYGDWGTDFGKAAAHEAVMGEWPEIVRRGVNHPSLILWTPFNETSGRVRPFKAEHDALLRNVYQLTRGLDPTRPVIDTSGYCHVVTDVYDVHNYDQDVAAFAKRFGEFDGTARTAFRNAPNEDCDYRDGQPYFVSEYGGIWWDPGARGGEQGWGYGDRPASEAEYLERYRGLTDVLLGNPNICAFCYTQLYDIEQEVNGIYTYDRRAKLEPATMAEIRRVNQQPAAIESES